MKSHVTLSFKPNNSKEVACFQLRAGGVLRYSHGAFIEYYSGATYSGVEHWYSKRSIVQRDVFKGSLLARTKKQEISNVKFETVAKEIRDNLGFYSLNATNARCFNVPGGAMSRYSSDCFIEHLKGNQYYREITESTQCKVGFDSSLSSCSEQYAIDECVFLGAKEANFSLLNPLGSGLKDKISAKAQVELF